MINIEIITIGNELLSGMTVNTNTAFLGKQLSNAGYKVVRQTSLPDSAQVIKEELHEALQKSTIVIATGGLGPTCDDLTKHAAADLFYSDFYFDESVAAELEKRYGKKLKSLQDQATIPSKAEIIPNEVGTAPGLIFKSKDSLLILLPGVPKELEEMFSKRVLAYIEKNFPVPLKHFSEQVHIFGLPESDLDPHLRHLKHMFPQIETGIYASSGYLTVNFSVLASNKEAGHEILEPCVKFIQENFTDNLYESLSGKIEEAVQSLFIGKGITLSIAESCTGGSIAAHLTRLPGSSKYFLGSLVTYSNNMKIDLLKVTEKMLNESGAVSSEVVDKMAQSVVDMTNSDWGLAVSGIAGPGGGTPDKPVGTIWAAITSRSGDSYAWSMKLNGNREMIIEKTVNIVLGRLYALVKKS